MIFGFSSCCECYEHVTCTAVVLLQKYSVNVSHSTYMAMWLTVSFTFSVCMCPHGWAPGSSLLYRWVTDTGRRTWWLIFCMLTSCYFWWPIVLSVSVDAILQVAALSKNHNRNPSSHYLGVELLLNLEGWGTAFYPVYNLHRTVHTKKPNINSEGNNTKK